MTLREFSKFFQRNWLTVLITVLLIEIIGLLILNQFFKPGFENNIFYSVSVQAKTQQASIDPSSNLQAADQFTESLQGWLQDPTLISITSPNQSSIKFFKVQKEEKNNFLITYSSSTKDAGYEIFQKFQKILGDQLTTYNSQSDFNFKLSLANFYQKGQKDRNLIFFLVFLICSIVFGLASSYLFETFNDRIIFSSQLNNYFPGAVILNKPKEQPAVKLLSELSPTVSVTLGKTTSNDLKLHTLGKKEIIFLIH